MRRSRRLMALLAAALVSAPATAVVWRADAPPEAAFELAKKVHGSVGQVDRGGVATLIADRWAITAAHVAHGLGPANTVRFGERDYAIEQVFIHPQGEPDPARPRQPPEVDLALIKLVEPVVDGSTVLLYRGRDEVSKLVAIAGFGDFGPAGGPLTRGDGRLRVVENGIADAGPLRLFLPFDAPPNALGLEGIGGPGDSGGPALWLGAGPFPNTGPQIMGVSSGADGPPGAYGTVDVYTRVSSHIEWIEQVAGKFFDLKLTVPVEPRWPRDALISGTSGFVVVDFVVGVDGRTSDITVVESRPAGVFDKATTQAVARWKFAPRIEAGVPVARRVRQRVEYEMTD